MTSFVMTGGSGAGLRPVQGEGVQPVTDMELVFDLVYVFAAPAAARRLADVGPHAPPFVAAGGTAPSSRTVPTRRTRGLSTRGLDAAWRARPGGRGGRRLVS